MKLTWNQEQYTLFIQGVLDRFTLILLWQRYQSTWDKTITTLDVAAVTHVDSAGLALLASWVVEHNVKLTRITPQLMTLIELYHLQQVLNIK